MYKTIPITLLFSALYFVSSAQEKTHLKFGKIQKTDFEISSPLLDSNANAIIIADIGSSEFEGNNKGWFKLVYKRHKRIKILNKNGFDAAAVSIYLYTDGQDAEKIKDLKANTYSLESDNVITTSIENKSVFEERISKNLIEKKFTFPAVKVGSIIEYTYTMESDFMFNLQPWTFQSEYPCIWSEYEVKIPDFFGYVYLSQGYLKFDKNETSDYFKQYIISQTNNAGANQTFTLNTMVHDLKWQINNVPALKEENFTTTLNNHVAKVEFQLSEYRFPEQPVKKIMGDWSSVTEKLLEREDFGIAYTRPNNWLDDELKLILNNSKDKTEKAKKIYEFIRNNFTCTKSRGIYIDDKTTLKDVYKKRSGSVSELNLLLLAMLTKAEISCAPVILSLRNRGVVHPIYPLMDRFNYLIAYVDINNTPIYLDASIKNLGFNHLSQNCYNGVAWIIEKDKTRPIELSSDSIIESKQTTVFIINNKEGKLEGSIRTRLGEFESITARDKINLNKKESLLKEASKKFGNAFQITQVDVDSTDDFTLPITYSTDFLMNVDEDILYLNPLFGEETSKNPFTSNKRLYPVEMPYQIKEVIIVNMEIPLGYSVEEIPKSVRYFLNETEGVFEYLVVKNQDKIQLRSTIHIKKSKFSQEDYDTLREFFAFVIQKQGEQIVLKKRK